VGAGHPRAELAITSNEIFHLDEQPKRIVIVGGGYVACEFAAILNGLGTQVNLLYRGDQILRGFDHDVRDFVADAMRARGIVLEIQRDVVAIERVEKGLCAHLDNGETLIADQVMMATGRVPNTADMGLEALDVPLAANGAVEVDVWSQTTTPSIYAVGDVTDRAALTPVAIREGQAFAETVFLANRPVKAEHVLIPTAVFTRPEIGTVGQTEAEARAEAEVEIYRSNFRPMLHILAGRDERMLMKLIVRRSDRRVTGMPRRWPGRRRDHPDGRDRHADGRDEGRLRPHHGGPSHGG
jgi:glutathione reductase (NADPH)